MPGEQLNSSSGQTIFGQINSVVDQSVLTVNKIGSALRSYQTTTGPLPTALIGTTPINTQSPTRAVFGGSNLLAILLFLALLGAVGYALLND